VDYLFASHHKEPGFKSPGGYLCETGILLLVLSRYIGDPNVIDHHCGLVWGGPRPEMSLGPRVDNVIAHLISHSIPVLVSRRSPFQLHNWRTVAGGEPCGDPAISRGTQVQIPGVYLCETGILLLVLSRYKSLTESSFFQLKA
jgi:hypothetical protein